MAEFCTACPRACGVRRDVGELGVCKSPASLRVGRAALHMWEEPCISGSRGSGTVFFSGCNLGCVYCQNKDISRGASGKEITIDRLAEIFGELQLKGAENINLVTPTHYVYSIAEAIVKAKKRGLKIPVVYNCGGYESVKALKYLDGLIDIYLTDFKYADPQIALRYSGAEDYPEIAKKALLEMVRQCPQPLFDKRGIMTKGVIVRHLLLPNRFEDAKKIVRYLYDTYQNKIYISLMNQYTPVGGMKEYPELRRPVHRYEYDRLVDFAVNIGVEQGFIQEEGTVAESFIPVFDGEGV